MDAVPSRTPKGVKRHRYGAALPSLEILSRLRHILDALAAGLGQCEVQMSELTAALNASGYHSTDGNIRQALLHLEACDEISCHGQGQLFVRIHGLRLAARQLFGGETVMVRGPNKLWSPAMVVKVHPIEPCDLPAARFSSVHLCEEWDANWRVGSKVMLAFKDASGNVRDWDGQVIGVDADTGKLSIRFDEDGEIERGVDPDDDDLQPRCKADKHAPTRDPCGFALIRFAGLGHECNEWRKARCSHDMVLCATKRSTACEPSLLEDVDQSHSVLGQQLDRPDSSSVLCTSDEEYDSVSRLDSDDCEYHSGATKYGVASSEATSAEMAAEEEVEVAAAVATLPWRRGALVEALDKSNRWYAAKVYKYDLRRLGNNPRNRRVLVHFLGWGEEFDEWYNLNTGDRDKIRELTPSAEFGPFFHTRFAYGGQGYRIRVLKILEIVGCGNRIGFDSLVRSTHQITVGMLAGEAMKIVRKVAKLLLELAVQGVVKFARLSGFVDVVDTNATFAKVEGAFRPNCGELVEVLDDSMEWFLAEVISGPPSATPQGSCSVTETWLGDQQGYARCRFVGWSSDWDNWLPCTSESGDLPRVRQRTAHAKRKEKDNTAAEVVNIADTVEVDSDENVSLSSDAHYDGSHDATQEGFKEVSNIVFAHSEAEARMRKVTRQTRHTDEEKIGTTSAEDVPIDVLDTHTIKNKGAFARRDIDNGAFIGEYAGEVLLLASIQRRKSEYLFNIGGGLTIDASRKGNATRFMNHSSDAATCNVDARVVNHMGTRRVVFTANKFIKRGTEMMYDYGEAFTKNCGQKLI